MKTKITARKRTHGFRVRVATRSRITRRNRMREAIKKAYKTHLEHAS